MLIEISKQALVISIFVFTTMLLVDYINVISQGKISVLIKGGKWRQYLGASVVGVVPGCLGGFLNVTFYVRGLITFGAITGGMLASCGDESFVMLAMFPRQALILFGILLVLGVVFGWLTDKIVPFFKIQPCQDCGLHQQDLKIEGSGFGKFQFSFQRIFLAAITLLILTAVFFRILGPAEWEFEKFALVFSLIFILAVVLAANEHYLEEHITRHLISNHLERVFLWTFFALLFVEIGLTHWDLTGIIKNNLLWVLIFAGLIGIIPESGPHLIFVSMFAGGLIPFSVLLTSCMVQDGHGMLPLLSYSVKDSVLIKLFNLAFGLTTGLILFSFGI